MATGKDILGLLLSYSAGSDDLCDLACEPCHVDGKLKKGVGMCIDCQECLCQKCFDCHTLKTPWKKHTLMHKAQMLQSQVSLKKEDTCTEKCDMHEDEIIKYYCKHHRQFGCSVCITLKHRSCDNVTYIPNAAKDLTNNEEYQQAESQLKYVVDRSREIVDNHKTKKESLDKNSFEVVEMMHTFRREMNEALNTIEYNLIQRCHNLKSTEIDKLKNIEKKYKIHEKKLHESVTLTDTYKISRKNCKLYIATMKAVDNLNVVEDCINEVEHDLSTIECQIKFVPNRNTLETLKHTDAFGKLSKPRNPQIHLRTSARKKKIKTLVSRTNLTTTATEGDTSTIASVEYVQDINVRSVSDKNTCTITGIVALPANSLLLIDSTYFGSGNGTIKLLDLHDDSYVMTKFALSHSPFDATMIHDKLIAVTIPGAEKIALVTVTASAMTFDKILNVDGQCLGIDYRDSKLAVSYCCPDRVQVLTLEGIVLYTIRNKHGQSLLDDPQYVSFGKDANSLFVSNMVGNDVVHVKIDGTIVGIYTDWELGWPRASFTDNSGNAYVCGMGYSNVHQFTPDCKKIRTLLTTHSNGRPHAIGYNEQERILCVGLYKSDIIKVYRVILRNK